MVDPCKQKKPTVENTTGQGQILHKSLRWLERRLRLGYVPVSAWSIPTIKGR